MVRAGIAPAQTKKKPQKKPESKEGTLKSNQNSEKKQTIGSDYDA